MKMEEHKKEKCFLQKKNVIKEETNEEKLNRFIFEACEKCVSNPDSETEFDTILEQCASEKSRKVKIKNGSKKSDKHHQRKQFPRSKSDIAIYNIWNNSNVQNCNKCLNDTIKDIL